MSDECFLFVHSWQIKAQQMQGFSFRSVRHRRLVKTEIN